jgi:IclR family transcriptional regulator, acetate operon repressor
VTTVGPVAAELSEVSVRSVDRAVSLLQLLAVRGESRGTDLADQLGIHKSTVSRLLATLEARGLVERVSPRGGYQLAYGVLRLATAASRGLDLTVVGRPVCERLAARVGETVNLAVRDGLDVVSVDQVIGAAAVSSVNWVGHRSPLHCTSAGKVFLAAMPADELAAYLDRPLARFTAHTLVTATALAAELDRVRREGCAITRQEQEVGLNAVSAPVRSAQGQVVAAVAVSGPSFRLTEQVVPEVAGLVAAAADEISHRQGLPKLG